MPTPDFPTNDPSLRSWIDSANDPAAHFPVQNLPFGVFIRQGAADAAPRIGVAIGDQALDLSECWTAGLFAGTPVEGEDVFARPALNDFLSRGPGAWSAVRQRASNLLRHDTPTLRDDTRLRARAIVPQRDLRLLLPAIISDYTDFYASIHHAMNVGAMFRPEKPLMDNYRHLPVGYHGRASSVIVSGQSVRRPMGQVKNDDEPLPRFAPTARLDYEAEMGFFIGPGNELGRRIPIADAERHIFGMVIVNDWSARDVQKWEYQPLGPFNAKNFATSISPWVVTLDALAPFRLPGPPRSPEDPPTLDYLKPAQELALDITIETLLESRQMRERSMSPHPLARANFKDMHWTIAQMLVHHTSTGCNMRPGDLLASGTISGPAESNRGCLLELTQGGKKPIDLPTGEQRRFLEDGDTIILRAWAERSGLPRIGFGECRATITPAE